MTSNNLPADIKVGDRRSGTSRGRLGCHVYREPGTYYPKAILRDRAGNVMELPCPPVTVTDQDAAYPGLQTVCISHDENFTGAPAGARLVTTDAQGNVPSASWNEWSAVTNLRVLFKRGSNLPYRWPRTIRGSRNIFSAFGEGDTPDVRLPMFHVTNDYNRVVGIGVFGGYNPAAPNDWWNEETPPPRPPAAPEFAGYRFPLVLDCHFNGLGFGLHFRAPVEVGGVGAVAFVVNTRIENSFDYHIFGSTLVALGCTMEQPPDVGLVVMGAVVAPNRIDWNTTNIIQSHPNFGDPIPNWPRHVGYRGPSRNGTLISKVYARYGGGHSRDGTDHQAIVRFSSNAAIVQSNQDVCDFNECHFIGAMATGSSSGVGDGVWATAPRHARIDSVVFEVTADQTLTTRPSPLALAYPGWDVQNCLFLYSDPRALPGALRPAIDYSPNTILDWSATFLRLRNNTFAVLEGNTTQTVDVPIYQIETITGHPSPPALIVENNVVASDNPRLAAPTGPVSQDIIPLSQFDTAQLVPTPTLPASGSVPVRDADGALRPAQAAQGWRE